MKGSFSVALHSRPPAVSVSTREFTTRLQDRGTHGGELERVRSTRTRAHLRVAHRAGPRLSIEPRRHARRHDGECPWNVPLVRRSVRWKVRAGMEWKQI